MSDTTDFAMQLVVPLVTAPAVYAFLRATKRDVEIGGCLSTIIAFLIVTVIALATYGMSSTLPIGLTIAAGFAFVISESFFAIVRWIEKRRLK